MELFFAKRAVTFLLHILHVVLLIYGVFLTVCGVMIIQDLRSFGYFLESKIFWLPYFITFNGLMMVILATLGYYATGQQNYKLLVTFAVSAFIVLLVEIAIVTWVSSQNPSYADNLRLSLRRSFSNYMLVEDDRVHWDRFQRKLQCCGIDGPQNWGTYYTRNQVPASCCLIASDQAGALCLNTPNSEIVHQLGCHPILYKRIVDHWSVVSLLAAIAAFIQLIALVLSVAMAFLVKRAKVAKERQ